MNKPTLAIITVLVAGLAVSLSFNAFLCIQNQDQIQTTSNLTQRVDSLTQQTGNLTYQTNNLTQQISNLLSQQTIGAFNGTNYEAAEYYNEFGAIPATNVNASFVPPISMYRALQIALEADGWNKTSLRGMVVGAYLMQGETQNNAAAFPTSINGPVTNPPSSYADVYNNNGSIVRQYMWEIVVNNASRIIHPPLGFSLIDAATGWILPNPPLY